MIQCLPPFIHEHLMVPTWMATNTCHPDNSDKTILAAKLYHLAAKLLVLALLSKPRPVIPFPGHPSSRG